MHTFEENNLPVLFTRVSGFISPAISQQDSFHTLSSASVAYSFLSADLAAPMSPFQGADIVKCAFGFTPLIVFGAPLFHYFAFRLSSPDQ